MSKKFFDWQIDLSVIIGIFLAIRLIYTKEINGYTVNTLTLLIYTIINAGIYRSMNKETNTSKENPLKNEDDVGAK